MAQHDYVLDNADGATFRGDLNAALAAIVSQNSGATAPATTYPYQLWFDTSTGLLKQRNAANTAWTTLDAAANALALSGGTITGNLNITGTLTAGGGLLNQGTTVATTSGTSVDFTGIPSWAKRITVLFNGVSTSGTSAVQVQLGTSGGIDATGYASAAYSTGATSSTTGMVFDGRGTMLATSVRYGSMQISAMGSNLWVASGAFAYTDGNLTGSCAGGKTLPAQLDRIRVTTVNGTDTFDAGSVNILYE